MQVEKEILVIDDNRAMLSILKAYLVGHGFKVQTCSTALDAIALASERRFDVYIIDYRLPDYNGDTVTTVIRGIQPSAIIVGFSIEPKEQAFLDAGADKFIFKERLTAGLLAVIRRASGEPF